MTFFEHLAELRSRLIWCILVVFIVFCILYAYHSEIFNLLTKPVIDGLRRHGIFSLQALQVTEALIAQLEVCLISAIFVSSPYIFYQIWAFVSPGLYPEEKKYVLPVVGLVSAFFIYGVVFSYFIFLPMIVDFLVGYSMEGGTIQIIPTVEKTVSLCLTFLLIFGLVFELPLLMFFLSLIGFTDHKKYWKYGRYFMVVAFIIGGIFTPPDPLSQVLMAVPMCILYYVGTLFSWVAGFLRKDKSSKAPTYITVGAVILLGAVVSLASYLWSYSNTKPISNKIPRGLISLVKISTTSKLSDYLTTAIFGSKSIPEKSSNNVSLVLTSQSLLFISGEKCFSVDGEACSSINILEEEGDNNIFEEINNNDLPLLMIIDKKCISQFTKGEFAFHLVTETSSLINGMAEIRIKTVGSEISRIIEWSRNHEMSLENQNPLVEFIQTILPDSWQESGFLYGVISQPRLGRSIITLFRSAMKACR